MYAKWASHTLDCCTHNEALNASLSVFGDRIFIEVCLGAQSCLTLRDPMDCSLPGSFVHRDSPGKNPGVGSHVLHFIEVIKVN